MTDKAIFTKMTTELAKELNKNGYAVTKKNDGTFEVVREEDEVRENFERAYKKIQADLAHDETIPF